MLGKVTVCNIRELELYRSDVNLLITLGGNKIDCEKLNLKRYPSVAPSPSTFKFAKSKDRPDDWFETYKVMYNADMSTTTFQGGLFVLCEMLNKGVNVTLVCFCDKLDECHRKLLGEYLELLGYVVEFH